MFRGEGAIFSPEHGISGTFDQENVADAKDEKSGIPVFSLYRGGSERRPTSAMLDMVDVIVFDIQDIGARFYTYMSTMGYAMEEADKRGMPFYVLDRPNPITGVFHPERWLLRVADEFAAENVQPL